MEEEECGRSGAKRQTGRGPHDGAAPSLRAKLREQSITEEDSLGFGCAAVTLIESYAATERLDAL
jgi:hypothetical protein